MAAYDLNLNFLTLNVQGLRKQKTRQSLFRSLKRSKYDVITLQETHLIDSDSNSIQHEWNGNFHLSAGDNRSKGLLTLFNNSISHLECSIVQKDDRVMTSLIKIDKDKHILVTNVYSPCDSILNRLLFLYRLRDLLSDIYNKDFFIHQCQLFLVILILVLIASWTL